MSDLPDNEQSQERVQPSALALFRQQEALRLSTMTPEEISKERMAKREELRKRKEMNFRKRVDEEVGKVIARYKAETSANTEPKVIVVHVPAPAPTPVSTPINQVHVEKALPKRVNRLPPKKRSRRYESPITTDDSEYYSSE